MSFATILDVAVIALVLISQILFPSSMWPHCISVLHYVITTSMFLFFYWRLVTVALRVLRILGTAIFFRNSLHVKTILIGTFLFAYYGLIYLSPYSPITSMAVLTRHYVSNNPTVLFLLFLVFTLVAGGVAVILMVKQQAEDREKLQKEIDRLKKEKQVVMAPSSTISPSNSIVDTVKGEGQTPTHSATSSSLYPSVYDQITEPPSEKVTELQKQNKELLAKNAKLKRENFFWREECDRHLKVLRNQKMALQQLVSLVPQDQNTEVQRIIEVLQK